jgi:molybdate transport system permease protein
VKKRFSVGNAIVLLLGAIALLFFILPILALIGRSLQFSDWERLLNSGIPAAIWLSLITTAGSMLLTITFGTPLAWIFARKRFPMRRFLNVVVELPIVLPPAVAGLALLVTFGRRGVIGAGLDELGITIAFTTFAVVLAQTFVAAPFYIRTAQIGFQNVPPEIEAAAQVDGADGWSLFRRVTLPLSFRALSAGLVLAWARALGEFGATILFAGSLQGRTQTLPLLIYNVLERDINAAIWTGLLLIGVALIALLLAQFIQRGAAVDEPSS